MSAPAVQAGRGGKQIDEGNVLLRTHLPHRLGVQGELAVVLGSVGQMRALHVFVRDRREDDQPRGRLAVVLLRPHVVDHLRQITAERAEGLFSLERLVVSEEAEDDVRLDLGQPLVGTAEVCRPVTDRNFVRRKAEVAERQVQFRVQGLDVGFQPAVMLHPVRQRVADVGDVVIRFQFEQGLGGDGGE